MKKNGLTLMELVITMVIVGIAGLAIMMHFVAEHRFRQAAEERIVFAREARAAMDHMVRVLRFAIADPDHHDPIRVVPRDPPPDSDVIHIYGTIESEHLTFIDNDIAIHYQYNRGQDTIRYEQEDKEGTIFNVAENISTFWASWSRQDDPNAEPEFEIRLRAESEDGTISIPLRTKFKVLGR